jgi:hypothetical protein
MSIRDHAGTSGGNHQSLFSPPGRGNTAPCIRIALAVLAVMPLLLTPLNGLAANDSMGWPEATAQLTSLRTKAETCLGLLKGHGSAVQQTQGRIPYANAKGDIDAVITGLTVALATGGQPDSLPSLQERLTRGSAGLQIICQTANEVTPSTPEHKGIIDDIAKAALDPLIKAVSDAVGVLYNDHRQDADLTRKTIRTQLEAAKWPDFDEVPKVQ